MKSVSEMLLRLLEMGQRVVDEGNEYAMDVEGSLCVVMKDDDGNERPIRIDCDMKGFRKLAEKIGKDELWIRCCAMQLYEYERKQ